MESYYGVIHQFSKWMQKKAIRLVAGINWDLQKCFSGAGSNNTSYYVNFWSDTVHEISVTLLWIKTYMIIIPDSVTIYSKANKRLSKHKMLPSQGGVASINKLPDNFKKFKTQHIEERPVDALKTTFVVRILLLYRGVYQLKSTLALFLWYRHNVLRFLCLW